MDQKNTKIKPFIFNNSKYKIKNIKKAHRFNITIKKLNKVIFIIYTKYTNKIIKKTTTTTNTSDCCEG